MADLVPMIDVESFRGNWNGCDRYELEVVDGQLLIVAIWWDSKLGVQLSASRVVRPDEVEVSAAYCDGASYWGLPEEVILYIRHPTTDADMEINPQSIWNEEMPPSILPAWLVEHPAFEEAKALAEQSAQEREQREAERRQGVEDRLRQVQEGPWAPWLEGKPQIAAEDGPAPEGWEWVSGPASVGAAGDRSAALRRWIDSGGTPPWLLDLNEGRENLRKLLREE